MAYLLMLVVKDTIFFKRRSMAGGKKYIHRNKLYLGKPKESSTKSRQEIITL